MLCQEKCKDVANKMDAKEQNDHHNVYLLHEYGPNDQAPVFLTDSTYNHTVAIDGPHQIVSIENEEDASREPTTPLPPTYRSMITWFLVDGPPTYEEAIVVNKEKEKKKTGFFKHPPRIVCESKIRSWSFVGFIIFLLTLLAILFIVFNVNRRKNS